MRFQAAHYRRPSPAAHLEVNLVVAIHEVLVLKSDGRTERFPVTDGDVAQAELRASLCLRPGDDLVVVTEHAYVAVTGQRPDTRAVRQRRLVSARGRPS